MPYRPTRALNPEQTQSLIEATQYGLLGGFTSRLVAHTLQRNPDRVGTDHYVSAFDLATSRLHPSCNPQIVIVTLAYHHRYMEERDPMKPWQRNCVNGENCWCYSQPTRLADQGTSFTLNNSAKFVGREFLLPEQERTARFDGVLPPNRRSCIVCYIREIANRVTRLEYDGIKPTRALNDHSIEVDVEGGYRKHDCHPQFYMRQGKSISTGISGMFPLFSEIQYRQRERREGGRIIHYLSHSPSMAGFR